MVNEIVVKLLLDEVDGLGLSLRNLRALLDRSNDQI